MSAPGPRRPEVPAGQTPADPAPADRVAAAAAVRRCERLARTAQATLRAPALSAALVRPGRTPWSLTIGTAGDGVPLGPTTQFRAGSVTKTFTAVLVLQLRDAGRLDLEDRLADHLPVPAHGRSTVRRLLSHTSGLQREPSGDVWDTLDVPDPGRLLAELDRAEAVLPPGRRWHYGNLAYALLGQVVERLHGASWAEVLHGTLLGPLGLGRTTVAPEPPAAVGYLVEAYSDAARPEPPVDLAGLAPAAQLWTTAGDLARWMAFLGDPDPAVLAPATVDEMCTPVAMVDPDDWRTGWGLGLSLHPQDSTASLDGLCPGPAAGGPPRVHVGHGGAMPGFLAGAFVHRATKVAAAVVGSSGAAAGTGELAHALITASLAADPPDVEPWTPGEPPTPAYESALGRWWSEGYELVVSWRAGHLEARLADVPPGRPPAVFVPEPGAGADVLRTVSGREVGELLRLTRDADGRVMRMHWATYRCTRDQQTFA